MNVVQTGDKSVLQRHKQQLRETAAKDEARAKDLSREGVDDLFHSADLSESAAVNRSESLALAQESQRLRRNGREQSQRGLERLADGSDRVAQASADTEQGLTELKGSVLDLGAASVEKSSGLERAKHGLDGQAKENAVQGKALGQFGRLQQQDAKADATKAGQLATLRANQELREAGLDRQTDQLETFFIAGEDFQHGNAAKQEGLRSLQASLGHTVEAEALGDARDAQKLSQTWGEADQTRHQESSEDLKLSSIYQFLKGKALALNAEHHKRVSQSESQTAEGLIARGADLKTEAQGLLQNARCLEQSGQCHISIGRQMQCAPWTYCQGVALERQGCAELDEAQRLKGQATELRSEGQRLALQGEELRAKAEDSLARGEEFEVKAHGSSTRSQFLNSRSTEHQESAEQSAEVADRAALAAEQLAQAAEQEKSAAGVLQDRGTARMQDGLAQQNQALAQQSAAGAALAGELETESGLTEASGATTSAALKTVAQEFSFLGRGNRLLHKVAKSQAREATAQSEVASGIEGIESGLGASMTAQEKGVAATKLLDEARDLELEGLRLQNRGQKMLLEARPKLAESARLSTESFSRAQKADGQEDQAAQLITQGNEKIAAAAILRDKAAAYAKLAD